MLTQEQTSIELQKRKLALIYGSNETSKTAFARQLPFYETQIIDCHNFCNNNTTESYKQQFLERLNKDWNSRMGKRGNIENFNIKYYVIDNLCGLYWRELQSLVEKIKQWSAELQENQHLYVISTDKTVVNCFPIKDCFFTYKFLTAKEENDGVQYLVEYYRENIDYWEEVQMTRLSNYDCYEHLGWLLEDIISEQQSGGGSVDEASKRYFLIKHYGGK